MKYHASFLSKSRKDVANLSSAAVVIGALRVKIANALEYFFGLCVHAASYSVGELHLYSGGLVFQKHIFFKYVLFYILFV